jgi:hypothetical protein
VNALTDYIQNEVEQSEQAKQVLEKNMGWYQSIYAASSRGYTFSTLMPLPKLPITKLMMWLMFEKEKTEIEIKNIKRNGI